MNAFTRTACLLTLTLSAWAGVVQAGIQLTGTRVIYPAGDREVTVKVVNNGASPRLLQSWVDSGDPKQSAQDSLAPFMVTPPLTRIEPGKGQALRLMFTGATLPQDRESVFWLNVLEIPPQPKADKDDSQNFVQFAVRTRIKIFYRPKGLPGDLVAAWGQLTWRLLPQGSGYVLECNNSTPYNVSFSDVRLKGSAPKKSITKGGMCPAKGHETFPVDGTPRADGKLVFTAINDYGGFTEREADYSH